MRGSRCRLAHRSVESLVRMVEQEQKNALLAAIVESSDDAIISKTLDGIIVSWNGGAERLFGHLADAAIGQPITLIIPPELLAEPAAQGNCPHSSIRCLCRCAIEGQGFRASSAA